MKAVDTDEKIVWSTCNVNCGSRCPLRLHVKAGRVVRVETDNTGDDPSGPHEIRACLRERALRKWVYSPERLLYPLKRTGKRGEGEFTRISWDEAADRIADKLRQVIDTHGNESVFRLYGTGNLGGVVSGREQIDRLMNLLGGQLNHYNSYNPAQITHGLQYTYGTHDFANNLSAEYPLQLIDHHYKQPTHSSYGNNPWLSEAAVQSLWINPMDAEKRGILHGDRVCVFNPMGITDESTDYGRHAWVSGLSWGRLPYFLPEAKNGSLLFFP